MLNLCYDGGVKSIMGKIDGGKIAQAATIGIIALVAAVCWSQTKELLYDKGGWIGPSVGFFVLLVLLGLNWLLNKSKLISATVFVFVLISFFFVFEFHWEYLPVLAVALLLFVSGGLAAMKEKDVRLKISIIRILKRGLPVVLTALSLLIASLYYFSPLSLRGDEKIVIPRPLFDTLADPAVKIAENQLLSQFSDGSVPVGTAETDLIKDQIYQSLNATINAKSDGLKEFFPLGLSIGVFFALKAMGVLFAWLVILSTLAVFKILVWTGAVRLGQQAAVKEVIEI